MANIPGVAINIVLDKSGPIPVIRVTDVSAYGGLVNGITGILNILQPDQIAYQGTFTNPDIYYFNGALFVAQKELRLANDANFQKGNYIVTYTARHAGYDDTTIVVPFTIDYTRPTGVIVPNIDVFTPSLSVNDNTNYTANNFTQQGQVRSWISMAVPGMTVGGDVRQFNLNINGHYYDSIYNISLQVLMTYMLTATPNVSIIDQLNATSVFNTGVPESLNAIFVDINNYKAALGMVGGTCKDDYLTKKQNYIYASTLFQNFIYQGTCGNKTNLVGIYNELKATLNNNVALPYTPTNAIIPTYNFGGFCGIGAVAIPLIITAQPQSQAKHVGDALALTAAASGTAPITYQWRKNGANIGGATNAAFNIGSLILGDAANYDVVVTDGLSNTLISNVAVIGVTAAVATFTAFWAWVTANPYAALQTADALTYQGNGVFNTGQPIIADFRAAPVAQFLVLKVPSAEPIKTVWNNTGINNGNIPDTTIWNAPFVTGAFRYYVTKQVLTLDNSATTTFA